MKDVYLDVFIQYNVYWMHFLSGLWSQPVPQVEPQQLFCCPHSPMLFWGSNFYL